MLYMLQDEEGTAPNTRGYSSVFGPDVTRKFLAENNLLYIVRSHECVQQGFNLSHDDTVSIYFRLQFDRPIRGPNLSFFSCETHMVDLGFSTATYHAKQVQRQYCNELSVQVWMKLRQDSTRHYSQLWNLTAYYNGRSRFKQGIKIHLACRS